MLTKSNHKGPPHFIDYDTKRALHAFLDLHCTKGENGTAIYEGPYTDEILCDEFNKSRPGSKAIPRHVESLRLKYIGILPLPGNINRQKSRPVIELEKRVEQLEERLAALEDLLTVTKREEPAI